MTLRLGSVTFGTFHAGTSPHLLPDPKLGLRGRSLRVRNGGDVSTERRNVPRSTVSPSKEDPEGGFTDQRLQGLPLGTDLSGC